MNTSGCNGLHDFQTHFMSFSEILSVHTVSPGLVFFFSVQSTSQVSNLVQTGNLVDPGKQQRFNRNWSGSWHLKCGLLWIGFGHVTWLLSHICSTTIPYLDEIIMQNLITGFKNLFQRNIYMKPVLLYLYRLFL